MNRSGRFVLAWPPRHFYVESRYKGSLNKHRHKRIFPFVAVANMVSAFPKNCAAPMVYPLVNLQKAVGNGPVEIVDFPIKNGAFPLLFVCSPEGMMCLFKEKLFSWPELVSMQVPAPCHVVCRL